MAGARLKTTTIRLEAQTSEARTRNGHAREPHDDRGPHRWGKPRSGEERQAQQTRDEILAAARGLFVERGYAATTIGDIASEAGVAVQTIYSSVGTKPELLVALTQAAIAGANVQELSHAGDTATDPLEISRCGARLRRQLMEQGGDVIRLVMETAPAEPEVDEVWQQLVSYSRQGIGGSVKRLRELDALEPGLSLKRATDLVWVAIHFRVYADLTELGWSHEQVEGYITDAFMHAVVDPRLWAPTLMPSGGHPRSRTAQ